MAIQLHRGQARDANHPFISSPGRSGLRPALLYWRNFAAPRLLLPFSFSPPPMKRLRSFVPRSNRRSVLRDLYAFGLVSVFRRHSIRRIWEPLRETPAVREESSQ